ncbi:MAG: hypothetical protein V3V00_07670 [Saprospiraceae bacterium]
MKYSKLNNEQIHEYIGWESTSIPTYDGSLIAIDGSPVRTQASQNRAAPIKTTVQGPLIMKALRVIFGNYSKKCQSRRNVSI